MQNSLKFPMFFMIFSYFWHELRRGLLELRRVLNLSSAGIDSSSAGFDLSSAGLLDDGSQPQAQSGHCYRVGRRQGDFPIDEVKLCEAGFRPTAGRAEFVR